ncbi:MAG: hypothetical protein IKJ19_03165 [Clostridia bacterium]|nr:hypothetical protein [Clostridia bacterium]
MKLLKRLVTFLLVLTVVISATACNVKFVNDAPPHMSKRTYKRIDDVAAYAIIDEIEELCAGENNLNALIKARDEMFTKYYNKLSTYYTVASINYDLDVTNDYWKTESEWIEKFYNEYHNAVLEVEKVVLTSSYADTFIEELGQDYADMILAAELETEEQLAIQARITELESNYTQLYQSGGSGFGDILIELVNKRNEYARTKKDANGEYYANFLDYAYAEIYGREYTPDEAKVYRETVLSLMPKILNSIVPYYSAYTDDINLDQNHIKELMPQIIEGTVPEMLPSWEYMMEYELYNFDVSDTKANTSYVTSFSEYGDAYMFLNASGTFASDLPTLIHEFGHYNEHFMSKEELSNDAVRSYDLAETHSQAFELITLDAVKEACNNGRYANKPMLYKSYFYNQVINGLYSIISACAVDEFEYAIYNAQPEQLSASFFTQNFKSWKNNLPYFVTPNFYDIPHIYTSPGYYISYSVSMVFSAIIWASEDPVGNYVKVVEYGSNNYLSTVTEAVGLEYPMDVEAIQNVAKKYKAVIKSDLGYRI